MVANRSDAATAVLVNQGIAMAALEGSAKGAQFMAAKGVPFEVAHRVLVHPGRRRHYDWR